jgi:hypothetical protein
MSTQPAMRRASSTFHLRQDRIAHAPLDVFVARKLGLPKGETNNLIGMRIAPR